MPFADYNEFAEPLALPINGKTYDIPPVSMADGLKLSTLVEENTPLANEDIRRILLGDAGVQMIEDGVPARAYMRALLTALSDFRDGRGAAEILWVTGGNPKALQALTTPEDEATTTPLPASGSGTKTPTKAARSRSPKSSSTGS